MKSPPQIFFNDFVKLIFPIFPIRPPLPIHPHLYLPLVRACKLPRIQVGNREVRDLMGMEPKLEHSSSSIFLLFFSALIYLFSLPFFGQRPRRGRSTVEHRGTFVRPFVCLFVCPFVPPSGSSGLKSGLSGCQSSLSGLKSSLLDLKSGLSGLKSGLSGHKSGLLGHKSGLQASNLASQASNLASHASD